ncbi:MAG: Uma2 family endonuclease [Roseofilum sp. SBFL]|uniref:Uma2 family endonuclease n=1 Tax=unclassified Roseofilum TaxID=2620099 RepID=UPI001B1D2A59|nr:MULTISPECIES: Uma2 family endonuclease [unclassified Roseofilum]MBP0038798.1 Uma2 family endonuclease [Roseofilum sp. SID1]MBP0043137.1 Uma2 family endonuclease [Roseofilum sp. SBFL]
MISSEVKTVHWTIDDLEGFPDNGTRYEIIDGELFMTKSPHWNHQDISGAIYTELRIWSKKTGLGKAVFCPGIIFSNSDNVIPDVVWISRERLSQVLDESGHLTGAPELAIEILSKSEKDKKRDKETKLKLYSVEGVQEYWIVDYQQREIAIYRRNQGRLEKAVTLFEQDTLTSPLLPDFQCPLEVLWED